MKEILQQYAACHLWANQRIIACLLKLPEELLNKEIPSSFSTIHTTLMHVWDAERIWWERLTLKEVKFAPLSFQGSTNDIARGLLEQDGLWASWLAETPEDALNELFSYRNSRGEPFEQPLSHVVMHLFNHGTYHRGQLVTMLRHCGVYNIPPTDFIVWSRS